MHQNIPDVAASSEAGTGAGTAVGGEQGATVGAEAAGTDAAADEGLDAIAALAGGGQIEAGYSDNGPDPSTIGGTLESVMGALNARGGMARKDFRGGGKVSASSENQKAKVKGDSYANDKIPAMLSEHEIVIPRKITMGPDPVRASAQFVHAVLAKRRSRK